MLTMFLLLGALLKAPLASSFAPTSTTVFRGISSVSSKKSSLGAFSAANTFFFPGQGAQTVGMAANLPGAKTYFDKASEILGYDLWEKVNQGPKEELDTTEVSQPAIFVASMAAVEHLKNTNPEAVSSATVACGLSLGEYSALCFADSISFEDGVRITKVRGEAMQAASDAKPSSMVSVIGLDSTKVKLLCEKATEISGEDVRIANYLCKGNYAVSGSKKACDVVCEIAKPEFKARMTVKLSVAGAFHTEFMSPAVPKLSELLSNIEIKPPRIPVISNVNALPHSDDPAIIREVLSKQVTSPVLWEDTIASLINNGYEKGYEVGPGSVIAGIMKRTDKTKIVQDVEV